MCNCKHACSQDGGCDNEPDGVGYFGGSNYNKMANPYQNIYGKGEVGNGTKLGSFVDIGGKVGKNCIIQCSVSIPPGVELEDNVFVGPGVNFANDKYMNGQFSKTLVKKAAKIGMNSSIGAGLTIGKNSVIGMGSVLLNDVPDNETWFGNPAIKHNGRTS